MKWKTLCAAALAGMMLFAAGCGGGDKKAADPKAAPAAQNLKGKKLVTGKRQALPSRPGHCRRQAERAADDKSNVTMPGCAEHGDFFRQLFRGRGLPRHIQHDQIAGLRHFF